MFEVIVREGRPTILLFTSSDDTLDHRFEGIELDSTTGTKIYSMGEGYMYRTEITQLTYKLIELAIEYGKKQRSSEIATLLNDKV